MNRYEKLFNDILEKVCDGGIWMKESGLKVGVSYIYIENAGDDDENIFSFEFESPEYSDWDSTINEFFEDHEDVKFCFVLDKAIDGNFVSWKEFCEKIDNGESLGDVFSL